MSAAPSIFASLPLFDDYSPSLGSLSFTVEALDLVPRGAANNHGMLKAYQDSVGTTALSSAGATPTGDSRPLTPPAVNQNMPNLSKLMATPPLPSFFPRAAIERPATSTFGAAAQASPLAAITGSGSNDGLDAGLDTKSAGSAAIDPNTAPIAKYCRDACAGQCQRANCRFMHAPPNFYPVPDEVCKDFASGRCTRSYCRHFHGTPADLAMLKASGRDLYYLPPSVARPYFAAPPPKSHPHPAGPPPSYGGPIAYTPPGYGHHHHMPPPPPFMAPPAFNPSHLGGNNNQNVFILLPPGALHQLLAGQGGSLQTQQTTGSAAVAREGSSSSQ